MRRPCVRSARPLRASLNARIGGLETVCELEACRGPGVEDRAADFARWFKGKTIAKRHLERGADFPRREASRICVKEHLCSGNHEERGIVGGPKAVRPVQV